MRRWEQQELHRFLAEASARLAESLDYRAVASRAMDLLVPRYADWCTIWLEGSDDLVPGDVYTRPGELEPSGGHATPMIETVLRTRRSELVHQISDAQALSDALGAHNMAALRACGARSLIGVPLIAGDRLVGALVLVAGDARPRYGVNDRLFAEDFAHRLGVAIDNALLYRKAELATRAREDMLAIVSHDLRTPLSMILADAELVGTRPELQKVSERIVRGVRRMTRLIGDLVDAAAIDAGRLVLECEVTSVAALLSEAAEVFIAEAKRKAIALVTEPPAEPAFIVCDRDRILQVLSNLISNALTFTETGGTVTVRAERGPAGIRLEVRDTGCGIPPDQVPHLFERYWRARARRMGAGLGLFISGGIVKAHGSTLDVETSPGQGSRFSFVLPEARQALDNAT
jgi:signal transduction histidine kinase